MTQFFDTSKCGGVLPNVPALTPLGVPCNVLPPPPIIVPPPDPPLMVPPPPGVGCFLPTVINAGGGVTLSVTAKQLPGSANTDTCQPIFTIDSSGSTGCTDTNTPADNAQQIQNAKHYIKDRSAKLEKLFWGYVEDISPATTAGGSNSYVSGVAYYPTSLDTIPISKTSSDYWCTGAGPTDSIHLNFVKLGTGVLNSARSAATLSPAIANQDTVQLRCLPGAVLDDSAVTSANPSGDGQTWTGTIGQIPHPMTACIASYLAPVTTTTSSAVGADTGDVPVSSVTGLIAGLPVVVQAGSNYAQAIILSIDTLTSSINIGCGLGTSFSSGATVTQPAQWQIAYTDSMTVNAPTANNWQATVAGDVVTASPANYIDYRALTFSIKFAKPVLTGAVIKALYIPETSCNYWIIDDLTTVARIIPVLVNQNGGYQATASAPASWTYDLYEITDATMANKINLSGTLSPLMNRTVTGYVSVNITAASAGSIGEACWTGATPPVLQLLWVQEVPATGC